MTISRYLRKKYTDKDISHENNEKLSPPGFVKQAYGDHPIKMFLIFFGDMVQAICVLLLPFAIRDLVDVVTAYDPINASGSSIWDKSRTPLMNLVWINLVWALSARLSGTSLAILAPVMRLLPRKRMTSYLSRHSINFFQDAKGGALGTKINTATVSLGHSTWVLVFDIWPVIIQFITSCVLIYFANIQMGIVITIWCFIYLSIAAYLAFKRSYWSERIAHERAKITGAIVDVATNIQAVKSFANEAFEEKKLDRENEDEIYAIIMYGVLREIGGWIHSIMSFGAMIGLLIMAIDLYQENIFTIGDIAFVFSLILILLQQAKSMSYAISSFLELFGQMADGVRTVFQKVTLEDAKDATDLNVSQSHIEFKDISFEYPESQNEIIFNDFSLDIRPNQKIGLIGRSGAGKTTLVNLLLRFFDVQSGSIEIDGQDVKSVSQRSIRASISVIPQDTALFHRTLLENIRYGRLDASDEEVIDAAKRAHADEFISKLPDGYDTMVGERGVKLSGGQRQRIAIARAILKDAPILILDEATSALDSESEKAIQESLQSLMEGKTVIAIAHRLSTINHLDRLIVMDKGKIIEDGSHDKLLSEKGLYAKLWNMQSGGFLGE